jgi:hypothetical protein
MTAAGAPLQMAFNSGAMIGPSKFYRVPTRDPENEPWWIAQADFLRLEYTAEQVSKLLGVTSAMVKDLQKRGLLKLTKGRATDLLERGERNFLLATLSNI